MVAKAGEGAGRRAGSATASRDKTATFAPAPRQRRRGSGLRSCAVALACAAWPLGASGVYGGGRTTYGEITLGANIKPSMPKNFEGFVIRPELRFDQSLNGTKPFDNNGTSGHQLTFATDFVLPF